MHFAMKRKQPEEEKKAEKDEKEEEASAEKAPKKSEKKASVQALYLFLVPAAHLVSSSVLVLVGLLGQAQQEALPPKRKVRRASHLNAS